IELCSLRHRRFHPIKALRGCRASHLGSSQADADEYFLFFKSTPTTYAPNAPTRRSGPKLITGVRPDLYPCKPSIVRTSCSRLTSFPESRKPSSISLAAEYVETCMAICSDPSWCF